MQLNDIFANISFETGIVIVDSPRTSGSIFERIFEFRSVFCQGQSRLDVIGHIILTELKAW